MAKILVIDDSPEILEMSRMLLENRGGHQAVLRSNGESGLESAFADPPDLVIVDVMMPDITGYEVCRRLRAHRPTSSLPILILTARGQSVDREAALEAGADAYMSKPVQMNELLTLVDDLLSERGPAAPPPAPRTIALLSLRGGVGLTTLAVNLAATIQSRGSQTCLVDLSPSSGHVALQLGLRPQPNWSALVQAGDLEPEDVEDALLQHTSGLHILASPMLPATRETLSQITVEKVFESLQQRFDILVVDMPPLLNKSAMVALRAATTVEMVVTVEPASIQTAVGTIRALKQHAGNFQIVVNQVKPEKQLPPEALKRVLRQPIVGTTPFDPAQAEALASGNPLVLSKPNSPLARSVEMLAQELARAPQGAGRS